MNLRDSAFLFLAACCALLAASGCQTLSERQIEVRTELATIDPRTDPLARSTSIVDIHTHTFNARYLPLEGILLGKRDAVPPFSWLISDRCAKILAQALVDRTTLAPVPGMAKIEPAMGGYEHHSLRKGGPLCRIFLRLLNKAADAGAWDESMTVSERMKGLDEVADGMNFQERLALRTATQMMGMDEVLKTPDKKGALRGAVRFLWLLTQSDEDIAEFFRREYAGAQLPRPPLMVSHMMDLGPVYNQRADGESLLRFEDQQILRMETFQAEPESGILYFVAYDPYRDDWHGGKPGDALRVVQTAIRDHGAWGVKVYPPSGYRPAGNRIERRPGPLLTPYPGRQWDVRYGELGDNPNEVLDRRLEALLLWCIEEDVPVFVHAGTGEFEARKGYGLYHSDPRFWREFLEAHPEPDGSPCRLRLCLGHAGGGDFWFGGGKNAGWGREVYELCREFPNVYCEITTHGEFASADKQAYFVNHIGTLFAEPAGKRVKGHKYPFCYPFQRKLMYGTDWYLPVGDDRIEVLRATQQTFLHESLRPYYRDYYSRNAMRYLNVRNRLREGGIPGPVRRRLSQTLDSKQ